MCAHSIDDSEAMQVTARDFERNVDVVDVADLLAPMVHIDGKCRRLSEVVVQADLGQQADLEAGA
jgi:hypothetical protein